MALKAGKRDIARLAEVLDADYESVEEAAAAVMAEAWDIYEAKAKFTVVGQLRTHPFDKDDPAAAKAAWGRFGTEGQAITAARSFAYSAQTHESFRTWVLPVFHGTAADFYKERKKAKTEAERGLTQADGLVHRLQWQDANPGESRENYPGPPEPDPRTNCPICGASPEEEES